MTSKTYCVIFLTLFSTVFLNAQSTSDITEVAKFIRGLQYTSGNATGAFKKAYGNAYIGDGTSGAPKDSAMWFVEPYFTHISCIALLEAAKAGYDYTANITAVKDWMNWYIDRVDIYQGSNMADTQQALMVNYFYNRDGSIEVTCPSDNEMYPQSTYCNQIDAEDSDPTLFFMLINKYYKITNDAAWFNEANTREKIEGFAAFINDKLYKEISSDNALTIAKRSYQQLYTMDNAEVYAGLNALDNLEKTVYATGTTEFTTITRQLIQKALVPISNTITDRKLYPPYNSPATTEYNYLNYKIAAMGDCDGFLGAASMYDFTPMLWPVLFGLDNADSGAANSARKIINTALPDWDEPDWSLSAASRWFSDPSVGYYFSISENTDYQAQGKKQADSALPHFIPGNSDPGFISDAGWLLLNLLFINGKNLTVY